MATVVAATAMVETIQLLAVKDLKAARVVVAVKDLSRLMKRVDHLLRSETKKDKQASLRWCAGLLLL